MPPAALIFTGLRIEAGAHVDIATHLRVDEILAGGTLALGAMFWGERLRAALSRAAFVWGLLIAIAFLWMVSSHPAGGALAYARPYLGASLVAIVMHSRLWGLHAILEGRIAAYIARISYALYIYHPLMIFGWMNTGGDWTRYLLKRPISYALTWAAAHASTTFWESRWQTLAKRLTQPETAVRTDN